MADQLSHVDEGGAARMVDVSGKQVTARRAVAEGFVVMAGETMKRLRAADVPKGEVLGTARIAGIMAAKRTAELIPLCHPLPIEQVTIDFEFVGAEKLRIVARTIVSAKTGVEMEALVAVTVAGLTVYDMLKAIDKGMRMEGVRVVEKSGGKADFKV